MSPRVNPFPGGINLNKKVTRAATVPASDVMPLLCISKITFAFAVSEFAWNLFGCLAKTQRPHSHRNGSGAAV